MTVPAGKGIKINELNKVVPHSLSSDEGDCNEQVVVSENILGPSNKSAVSNNAPAPHHKAIHRVTPQSSDDSSEESDGHFSLLV